MAFDTMRIPSLDIFCGLAAERADRILRLTLIRGEALRVPRTVSRLRVLSGVAWVSFEGEDILQGRGEVLSLPGGSRHDAVISSTGDDPLFFEIA
jgi:hypothetical protein